MRGTTHMTATVSGCRNRHDWPDWTATCPECGEPADWHRAKLATANNTKRTGDYPGKQQTEAKESAQTNTNTTDATTTPDTEAETP